VRRDQPGSFPQTPLVVVLLVVDGVEAAAAVLVGNPAPPPNRHRPIRQRARPELLARVDLLGLHDAAVSLVVAEIEHVAELVAGLELAHRLELGVIEPHQIGLEAVVREADQRGDDALTGIIGARRAWTVSMISALSIPCR
jgi:hypothetical protein